jgi:hypothetical protein
MNAISSVWPLFSGAMGLIPIRLRLWVSLLIRELLLFLASNLFPRL